MGNKLQPRRHHADNRSHAETGDRLIGFEHSDHIDFVGRQSDLLIRLAKGGRYDAAVLRVDPATGESHLPCMPPERVGTPRQNRSEEHTSELQSLMRISYAVFCLKKKKGATDMTQARLQSKSYI